MAGLRLEAVEFVDLTRWRWVLTGAKSNVLAEHAVRLDRKSWQFEAFTDLVGYLSLHVAPDKRAEQESRVVADLGRWIGAQVLGPVADALALTRPVTVRVVVPHGAGILLAQPLELGYAGEMPLSAQDVVLVMETGPRDSAVVPAGGRLRVLGLFSVPEGGHPLSLRRERQSLVRLIEGIAAAGKAADVRVMQYGVTRERLRDVLADGAGWDVIHVSGHGRPGGLLLETDTGAPDEVSAAELADLLASARSRVRLVVLSACWSAAAVVAEQRRLLDLPAERRNFYSERGRPVAAGTDSAPMAARLAARLDCAVLAMRFPVEEQFGVAFSGRLYELLVTQGLPLPRAVGLALADLTSGDEGRQYSALSLAAPALFGGQAAELVLEAPEVCDAAAPVAQAEADAGIDAVPKMAGFPPQPEKFAGRTGVMARSSTALAAGSGVRGVMLHGMPGGGKTACTLELAYVQEHAFDQLIWHKAPDDGMDVAGSLTDFAFTLERYLNGFAMIDALIDSDRLTSALRRLTGLMEQRRVLIVIDNIESLLSPSGHWLDPQWAEVIGALSSHSGPSRLVLTSRRMPLGLTRLRMEAVDALTADETLLLLDELPNLSALKLGQVPGIDPLPALQLAIRAMELAQGHPKLLELAEAQAASPGRLSDLLESGDQAWRSRGDLPAGFFATGEATAFPDGYLHVLTTWTAAVTETLAPDQRTAFWLLCCLEEADREERVVADSWTPLWEQMGRDGPSLGHDQALDAVTGHGLAARRGGASGALTSYAVHPAIAAAGRHQVGAPFQEAVDNVAARIWTSAYWLASGQAADSATHADLAELAGK